MPSRFDHHIGIDYSGASKPETRSASIQVYSSSCENLPTKLSSPSSTDARLRNWNRIEVFLWLCATLDQAITQEETCIIGVDHGFSFPIGYFHRYDLKIWDDFLADFAAHWPTDGKGTTVESLRINSKRTGTNDEFRLTERWTSSAKSVFQFDVNGSVAKSTHAGLPFLSKLRNKFAHQLHCWPFDGWYVPSDKSVIAEVYPSLFRRRYPREGRAVDQQDAYGVSRWLMEMNRDNYLRDFFVPPLNELQQQRARTEGWILGVM